MNLSIIKTLKKNKYNIISHSSKTSIKFLKKKKKKKKVNINIVKNIVMKLMYNSQKMIFNLKICFNKQNK